MTEYRILFRSEAETQIQNSYEWGLDYWGEIEANRWLRDLYTAIFRRLTSFPLSCPVAPESEETDATIRQYILRRRYRILFEIQQETVVILQFRGPFTESSSDE